MRILWRHKQPVFIEYIETDKRNNEEKRKIEELSILIKQFGLLDPILVRTKDNKYEIIMGNDKYQAALIANQKMVPVIVKEINDDVYTKYSNVDKTNNIITNDFTNINISNQEENKMHLLLI